MSRIVLLGIVLGAVLPAGCKNSGPKAATPPGMSQGSTLERIFAKGPPGPPKTTVPLEPAHEPKGPLKSETVAVFADLAVEATFNNEDLTPSERDRRLDDARIKFERALQKDPKNLEALKGLGRLYTRLGDRERAAQIYRTACQHHADNPALVHEAAMSFGRFEDWSTAKALWEHALTLDPASRKYPRMIGLAEVRLGNYEAGFAMLMRVCSEAEARTIMARELMDAGQAEAGKQQLDLALKADPAFAPALQMQGVQQAGHQQ